jgi:hypothetical protein
MQEINGMHKDTRVVTASMAGSLLVLLLTGCAGPRDTIKTVGPEIQCPEEIKENVTVHGSAVPVDFPSALAVNVGSPEHPGQIARRLMISVAPVGPARGIKVLSSTLTMLTIGGTLTGWAAIGPDLARSNAVDVIPGRLRIQPFLRAPTLQGQTMAVDVLVTPGSAAIDELEITTAPLWSPDLHPLRPETVQITLAPVRHLTVFDVVDGKLQLQLTAQAHSVSAPWSCSFESRLELVDHDSVFPDLWGLRKSGRRGAEDQWLALNDPTSGPFRAVFGNPEAARGFAAWLRATRSTRVAQYPLGLFQLEEPDQDTPPAANRTVATPFHGISLEEIQALDVKRLGE